MMTLEIPDEAKACTVTQVMWAKRYAKHENAMRAVREVWPRTKDNPGYQNSRGYELKQIPHVMACVKHFMRKK